MSVKIGDRVKDVTGRIGTVEKIADHFYDKLVLVRFEDNSLEKRFLTDLEPIRDSVRLTREEFNEYMAKVVDRETLGDLDDGTYSMVQITAELIGKRLEALLFGSGENE